MNAQGLSDITNAAIGVLLFVGGIGLGLIIKAFWVGALLTVEKAHNKVVRHWNKRTINDLKSQVENQATYITVLEDRLRQNRQDVILIKQQSKASFDAGYGAGWYAGREAEKKQLTADRELHSNVIDVTDRIMAERQSRANHPSRAGERNV
ncbi:MAG: hypothetical protein WAS05_09210 [Candidatus Nanopelagicales bacterium]